MPQNNSEIEKTFKYLLYSRAFRSMALIYMSLAFSLYLVELGIKIIDIGLIAAATILFMVFLTMALGYLGDRFGFKKELIIAELFAAAGASIIAISTSVAPIIIGMILGGLSGSAGGMRGAFSPGTNAFIANNFKDEAERIKKYSYVTLVASASAVGGSIMFGLITPISNVLGAVGAYRLMFGVSAIMLFGSLIFLLFLKESEKPKKTSRIMNRSSMSYTLKVVIVNSLGGIGMGVFHALASFMV